MRKLSVILMAVCVFTLAGCVKNAKVNLLKASPGAAKMAQEIADYVIKNGVKDTDCKVLQKCRKVVWGGSLGDSGVAFDFELKASKKFGKKTLKINNHMTSTLVGADGEDYPQEITCNFVDKKADGVIDYMDCVIMVNKTMFLNLVYKDGVVSVNGLIIQLTNETLTPEDIQTFYNDMLALVVEKIDVGVLK